MPSGNAIYTYTGPEESTDVQGQIFLKGESRYLTDNGVIAVCEARDDFRKEDISNPPGKLFSVEAGEDLEEGDAVYLSGGKAYKTPAKPKKAKSK